VHIVQGRYDLVCPFITAWQLHKAIAHSKLHIIPDAGHAAASNPLTQQTLVDVMNRLGKKG
jgi:proline iminopeptidase